MMRSFVGLLSLSLGIFSLGGVAEAAVCNVTPGMGAYPTIQSAANDVMCTEIILPAGVFTEQVTIGRLGSSVILRGAGAGRTIIRSPAVRAFSTIKPDYVPDFTYVIQVPPGNGAEFADFTIDGLANAVCGEQYFGIRYINANGSINRVVVENISTPLSPLTPAFACQQGVAVAATASTIGGMSPGTSSVQVLNSVLRKWQKVGFLANGTGADGSVLNSIVRGVGPQAFLAQNGIQASRGANLYAQLNIISDIHYTGNTCLGTGTQTGSGIISYQGASAFLSENIFINIDRGVFFREGTGAHTMTQNRFTNCYAGITSEQNAAGQVLISANKITGTRISDAVNVSTCFPDTGNGISLINETGSQLVGNNIADSARNGIELLPGTTGGGIDQNRTIRGTRTDVEDRGTGNTVTLTTCRTSQPAGLCSIAP